MVRGVRGDRSQSALRLARDGQLRLAKSAGRLVRLERFGR